METVKDREAWRATAHGVAKSQIRLSYWTATTESNLKDCIVFTLLKKSHHSVSLMTRERRIKVRSKRHPWQQSSKSKPTINTKVKLLSRVRLFATPWTVAYNASPSMGFSRQEYWNGLPFPTPEDLPNPGIKPGSPTLQAETLYRMSHQGSP